MEETKALVVSGPDWQILRCKVDGHLWARTKTRGPAPKTCTKHRVVAAKPFTQQNVEMRRRAVELAKAGMTLRAIGQVCGVSYEAVRLWLNAEGFGPEQRELAQWRRRESESEARAQAALQAAAKRNAQCKVCGTLLIGNRRVTCSPKCAVAWPVLRVHTEAGREAHRLAVAKSTIKNAQKRTPEQVAWAMRFLNGQTQPRSAWYVRGSKAEQLAREYGWRR